MNTLEIEKLLDAIYVTACDSIPNGLCTKCPVIQIIGDLRDSIGEKNRQMIVEKYDIEFDSTECQCLRGLRSPK